MSQKPKSAKREEAAAALDEWAADADKRDRIERKP